MLAWINEAGAEVVGYPMTKIKPVEFRKTTITQRGSPPDLKGVGQRDFLAQRLNAPVSFRAGQLLVEQFWLVRFDRERAQGSSLSTAHRSG